LGLLGWDGVKADSAFAGDIIDNFEGPSDTDSAACMGGIEEISLVTGVVIVVKDWTALRDMQARNREMNASSDVGRDQDYSYINYNIIFSQECDCRWGMKVEDFLILNFKGPNLHQNIGVMWLAEFLHVFLPSRASVSTSNIEQDGLNMSLI
jgi:hypothetical protein